MSDEWQRDPLLWDSKNFLCDFFAKISRESVI